MKVVPRDNQVHGSADVTGSELRTASLLRCPACRSSLHPRRGELACDNCGKAFPITDGIVDMRCGGRDYYFNPVPPDDMAKLIQAAPTAPWDTTLRSFLEHVRNVPEWIDNLAVDGRYSWKLFLELPQNARFLDFGCGLGNLSHNIAPHVGETVALDLTWERLQFARQRFARFNPNDSIVLVAGGDGPSLPFPDGYFDCIALSGVLEWVADDWQTANRSKSLSTLMAMLVSALGKTNPRNVQLRFLKELRRILKPDGELFVAIENRWSYEYFVGRPDHHSGLLYASLMPRLVANAYSIVRSRQPYRTYTHSLIGLSRLLKVAGLPAQEFYGLAPGYSDVREIIPARTTQTFWRPYLAPGGKDRLKRNGYLVPAFGSIARRKGRYPEAVLGGLLRNIASTLGHDDTSIRIEQCIVTGKDKVVLRTLVKDQHWLVKIPSNKSAAIDEAQNWKYLDELSGHAVLAPIVPSPLTSGSYRGFDYYVETAVRGVPLTAALGDLGRAQAAEHILQLLLKLHAVPSAPKRLQPDGECHRLLVDVPLAAIRQADIQPSLCDELEQRVATLLATVSMPEGLFHGDLSSDNVFVQGEAISGIIDWAYAAHSGIPILDIIAYIEGSQRLFDASSSLANNVIRLAKGDWPSPAELEVADRLYRHFGLGAEVHAVACYLWWLSHLGRQLTTSMRLDRRLVESHVLPMVEHLRGFG